jgi:hypothetical protein
VLFEDHARKALASLELSSSERQGILRPMAEASEALLKAASSTQSETAALHGLAVVLNRISDQAGSQPQATRHLKVVRVLNGALVSALDASAGEGDRLTATKRFVEANGKVLSASVTNAVGKAASIGAALGNIFSGLGGLTHVKPIPVLPQPLPQPLPLWIRSHPADGVFAAGVQRYLNISTNVVESARIGGAITGKDGHILAPMTDNPQSVLAVENNRIAEGAVGGLDVALDGTAAVAVANNHIIGCAGLFQAGQGDHGQAVVRLAGSGELSVTGNNLHDNGNRLRGPLLHEILIDWRGDITVQDNRIRHAGSASPGAGILILSAALNADLVGKLAQSPALEVEPAPEPPAEAPEPQKPKLDMNDFLLAGMGKQAGILQNAGTFGVGSFRMKTRDLDPSFALLEMAPQERFSVQMAETQAESWLNRPLATVFNPLIDFLEIMPPPLLFPIIRQRYAVHLTGNDIVASGPALLLLASPLVLVSATVVGNEFESAAGTGAVYLRHTDATVFAANRCQCLEEINVVVIRSGRSLVSVTGNNVLGTQPPFPGLPPINPVLPDPVKPGGIHLGLDLGFGAALTLKLDEQAILQAIQKKKETAYQDVAAEAETCYNLFAKQKELTVDPDAARLIASESAGKLFTLHGGDAGFILKRLSLGGETAPATETDSEAAPGTEAAIPERLSGGLRINLSDKNINLALDNANLILADPDLNGAAKLYGMARLSGQSPNQARLLVQSKLVGAGGVQEAALAAGVRDLTGVAAAEPLIAEKVGKVNLLEEIVGLAIGDLSLGVPPLEESEPPPEPPPDPRDHSMVIIGGSRVGAVNNVTTSGVHIHDAQQSIENNL